MWTTTTGSYGRVEFSSNNVFSSLEVTGEFGRQVTYHDVDYAGSSSVSDSSGTSHTVTLSSSQGPYFRILSTDAYGTAFTGLSITSSDGGVVEEPTAAIPKQKGTEKLLQQVKIRNEKLKSSPFPKPERKSR